MVTRHGMAAECASTAILRSWVALGLARRRSVIRHNRRGSLRINCRPPDRYLTWPEVIDPVYVWCETCEGRIGFGRPGAYVGEEGPHVYQPRVCLIHVASSVVAIQYDVPDFIRYEDPLWFRTPAPYAHDVVEGSLDGVNWSLLADRTQGPMARPTDGLFAGNKAAANPPAWNGVEWRGFRGEEYASVSGSVSEARRAFNRVSTGEVSTPRANELITAGQVYRATFP
jgi:hypothetical protein